MSKHKATCTSTHLLGIFFSKIMHEMSKTFFMISYVSKVFMDYCNYKLFMGCLKHFYDMSKTFFTHNISILL